MEQGDLFNNSIHRDKNIKSIGYRLYLKFISGTPRKVALYHNDVLVKTVDLSDKVVMWLWFTDGHLLPYTGKRKVHSGYNTQRRMMVPGRTNLVTSDGSGRIVDFEIQEGKG